jgi:hypothetical protein
MKALSVKVSNELDARLAAAARRRKTNRSALVPIMASGEEIEKRPPHSLKINPPRQVDSPDSN